MILGLGLDNEREAGVTARSRQLGSRRRLRRLGGDGHHLDVGVFADKRRDGTLRTALVDDLYTVSAMLAELLGN